MQKVLTWEKSHVNSSIWIEDRELNSPPDNKSANVSRWAIVPTMNEEHGKFNQKSNFSWAGRSSDWTK